MQTSLGRIANIAINKTYLGSMVLFLRTAEASVFEEPGAVVPHAGICAGGAG